LATGLLVVASAFGSLFHSLADINSNLVESGLFSLAKGVKIGRFKVLFIIGGHLLPANVNRDLLLLDYVVVIKVLFLSGKLKILSIVQLLLTSHHVVMKIDVNSFLFIVFFLLLALLVFIFIIVHATLLLGNVPVQELDNLVLSLLKFFLPHYRLLGLFAHNQLVAAGWQLLNADSSSIGDLIKAVFVFEKFEVLLISHVFAPVLIVFGLVFERGLLVALVLTVSL
jgi:hypothetical protein